MLKNTDSKYGLITKIFHWLCALAIIGLFVLGFWMVDLSYYSQWYKPAPDLHKSIGVLLFLVMISRLLWRLTQPTPKPLPSHKTWEQKSAHAVHVILYILTFVVMASGYLISTADGRAIAIFNWFEIPSIGELFNNQEDIAGDIHRWIAYGLIILAILHALAAIKHHFFDRDATLKRMWP
jgi:cytochrome b561